MNEKPLLQMIKEKQCECGEVWLYEPNSWLEHIHNSRRGLVSFTPKVTSVICKCEHKLVFFGNLLGPQKGKKSELQNQG